MVFVQLNVIKNEEEFPMVVYNLKPGKIKANIYPAKVSHDDFQFLASVYSM